jgi:hypothetical protein
MRIDESSTGVRYMFTGPRRHWEDASGHIRFRLCRVTKRIAADLFIGLLSASAVLAAGCDGSRGLKLINGKIVTMDAKSQGIMVSMVSPAATTGGGAAFNAALNATAYLLSFGVITNSDMGAFALPGSPDLQDAGTNLGGKRG